MGGEQQEALGWGIIGTGKIATDFCTALTFLPRPFHRIVAVASRSLLSAENFASKFGVEKCYGSYAELYVDPKVEVVYIGNVTSQHYECTMQALQAGKHVICEKPMSITFSQTKEIIHLAQSRNLLFVEGLWTKCLPVYDRIREELEGKTIGDVLMVSIELGLKFEWDGAEQITVKRLGGGTTLGLGCYAIHFANLVFKCERPRDIKVTGKLHPSGLDEESQVMLIYSGGRVAQISLSTVCNYSNSATIYGSKGFIKVPDFWCSEEIHCPSGFFSYKFSENTPNTNYPKTIGFIYEIEKVRKALANGQSSIEEITHEDSLLASEILNQIFHELGVDYNEITPDIKGKTVGWGIISSGKIANDFCSAIKNVEGNGHRIVAVASRRMDDAKKFADKYGISRCYDDYFEMAEDPGVDIVYIACINTLHAPLSKHFLSAGKAVLCEKPMTTSLQDTMDVISFAKSEGVLFVEGFWSRFFPVYKQLRKELENCTIGKIKFVRIEFGVPLDWNHNERIYNLELGGGITLDIGCYAIQLACLIFPKKFPSAFMAAGSLHEATGADKQVSITLSYDDHATVQIFLSGTCELSNRAVIYGTLGNIVIPSPFWCPLELETPSKKFKFDLTPSERKFNYRNSEGLLYEIEAVREAFLNDLKEMPEMTHEESLMISRIQSEILTQIGVGFKKQI